MTTTPRTRNRKRTRWTWAVALLLPAIGTATASLWAVPGLSQGLIVRLGGKAAKFSKPTRKVERLDIDVTLTAGGRIDSTERTIIECELERLDVNVRGYGYSAGGSSTIIELLPEGTAVRKGDVLCKLDSYDYEELLRQQQINMERVKTDHEQATLNLDIAKIAVVEYRDGIMAQTLKSLRGQIALSESDLERSDDRLTWTRNMLEKGYLPASQALTEEFNLNRQILSLQQSRTALRLFERFSAPKYLKVLASNILAAETTLNYQNLRMQRTKERLEKLRKQVDLCTIRAPHDGFLIYANETERNVRIEEGMTVRQKQRLFYLPDLKKMEVVALLHESIVDNVKPGMEVDVIVEGLPGREVHGKITAIAQLPNRNDFNDVKYFVGTVTLDKIPQGLKPGMSAEIEVALVHKPHVLTIPAEALTVDRGEDFCYVVHDDRVERRPITLGRSTNTLLEITSGLEEGEEVVADAGRMDDEPFEVADLVETAKEKLGQVGLTDNGHVTD